MAIVVEHDKRRVEILEKSFDLFCRDGYEDVTFQKIADACGITRTTLYIYFKNKKEIFAWSIKQFTLDLEKQLLKIVKETSNSSEKCIRAICNHIIDEEQKNHALFTVLLSYLMQIKKTGEDPDERVRRRTVRMRHLLSTLIIRGQNAGEFKKVPVKDVEELLYTLLESAIFRLAVLNQNDISVVKNSINLTIDGLLEK
ncbi:MAG: TetR/AcrR family transcriptional regulator [Treponema sp.]|nr:TetR/AcrR family transcriptional regulator [Treponema sp.]